MEKKLNTFYEIIRSFDFFGVYYTFQHNYQDKYRSFTGGLFFLLYLLFCFIYILIKFDGFINRKHMSLIYYDRKISPPDFLNFKNYSNNLAFGLTCDNEYGLNFINEFLNIKLTFVSQLRTHEKIERKKIILQYHRCIESDFGANYSDFFYLNKLYNYYCMDNTSNSISGFYTDINFNYYEFSILAKENSSELYNEFREILLNYECKFEIFYVDTTINVYDFKNPVKTYLNQAYNILLPDSLLKYNYFFKKISFQSHDNLLFDTYDLGSYLGFSRTEEYRQLKSLDRFEKSYENFHIFAKFFIRSDNIDRIVQRNYEKFTQFMAQLSTVLSILFLIVYLCIIKLNYYYSNFVIMKSLFNYDLEKNEKLLILNEKKDKNYINLLQTLFNDSEQNFIYLSQGNKFDKTSHNNNFKNLNGNNDKDLSDIILKKRSYENGYKLFELNVFQFFIYSFFCCIRFKSFKKKNKIYEKSFKKISNYIDITYYIQTIRNLQMLFYLILDKKTKLIINYLKTPIITQNKEYDFCELISNKYNSNIYDYNILSNTLTLYFNNLKKNKNLNSKDKKMLKFISNQLQ